jgi:hypothetical protein
MYDDDPADPAVRKPRVVPPLPPPPGFDSWLAWRDAGFPLLDQADEPDVPVLRLRPPPSAAAPVPRGNRLTDGGQCDFFGKRTPKRRAAPR